MSKSIYVRTLFLAPLLALWCSGSALAQNKVVVIPLDSAQTATADTVVASDARTNSVNLTIANQIVLSTGFNTGDGATIVATASITVSSNGGNNDNINCNIEISGTDGVRQSTYINDGFGSSTTFAMTQVRKVNAGLHTVLVECNEGTGSASTVRSRALSVIAVP